MHLYVKKDCMVLLSAIRICNLFGAIGDYTYIINKACLVRHLSVKEDCMLLLSAISKSLFGAIEMYLLLLRTLI